MNNDDEAPDDDLVSEAHERVNELGAQLAKEIEDTRKVSEPKTNI